MRTKCNFCLCFGSCMLFLTILTGCTRASRVSCFIQRTRVRISAVHRDRTCPYQEPSQSQKCMASCGSLGPPLPDDQTTKRTISGEGSPTPVTLRLLEGRHQDLDRASWSPRWYDHQPGKPGRSPTAPYGKRSEGILLFLQARGVSRGVRRRGRAPGGGFRVQLIR